MLSITKNIELCHNSYVSQVAVSVFTPLVKQCDIVASGIGAMFKSGSQLANPKDFKSIAKNSLFYENLPVYHRKLRNREIDRILTKHRAGEL